MFNLEDIAKIVIGADCSGYQPCVHQSVVTLKDGRSACSLGSFDICFLISQLAMEKINPGEQWSAAQVKEHFQHYKLVLETEKEMNAKELLNDIFSKNTPKKHSDGTESIVTKANAKKKLCRPCCCILL